MAFITTRQQLKEANSSLTVDLDIKSLTSFLNDAEGTFRRIIGIDAFAELEAKETVYAHTVMRSAIVNRALFYYADSGQLLISDSGMHVSKSDSRLPASDKKIVSFKKNVSERSWTNFEDCIQWMEKDLAKLPVWKDSPERAAYFSSFINFSSSFNQYSPIQVSAELFRLVRTEIDLVERDSLAPILGNDLMDSLKAKSAEFFTPIEKELVKRIHLCIAPLSFACSIPYLNNEFSVTGVYQVSQAAQADNIEVRSTANTHALQRTMNRLISRGEAELEDLRIWLNSNSISFPDYKKQGIAPMADINTGLEDTGVYFM